MCEIEEDDFEEWMKGIPENPMDCIGEDEWRFTLSRILSNLRGGKKKTPY